jgi:ATP-binding cassette subfamily C protein
MNSEPKSLAAMFQATRSGFLTAIVFSFFINLLAFVGPLYMLQIYDRVIASRSEMTLLFITLLAAFLLVIYALLERCRSALLIRLGLAINETARDQVFRAVMRQQLRTPDGGHALALRDLDHVREFATGNGFITLFDAPWVPIFIAACFVLHPWFGWVAASGTLVIFALAVLNELVTRSSLHRAARNLAAAGQSIQAGLRNIETAHAMAMTDRLHERWRRELDSGLAWQASASDRAGLLVASIKFARTFLQVASLGIGGYLVIRQEVTGGAMIAASILMTRALAPVEAAVASWNGFVTARIGLRRIKDLLKTSPEPASKLTLPEPKGYLSFEQVTARAPDGQGLVLSNVSFLVQPGEVLAVVGPSAAGKSSLVRVMLGIWPTLAGAVRLDGTELSHWDCAQFGRNIGYLPQEIELFSGTIAENIARLGAVDQEAIIEAAQMAGVHGMIQRLPEGYNTSIGEGGLGLSGGQRQRIGLARALYRLPALIVLDEPNSNLDSDGEAALLAALRQLRAARKTVIVVTHKRNVLAVADKVLVLAQGAVQSFGPRDDVLLRPVLATGQTSPIRRVSAAE